MELVVQFPARGSTQVLLWHFPGVLWLWHFLYTQQKFQVIHCVYLLGISKRFICEWILPIIWFREYNKNKQLRFCSFEVQLPISVYRKNWWHLKQNGASSLNRQDTDNVVHMSTSSQRIVSDYMYYKNVLNDYLHQNCPNFPGSTAISGLPNGYP